MPLQSFACFWSLRAEFWCAVKTMLTRGQIVESDHYAAAKRAQACSINCRRQKKYAQSLAGAQFYCTTQEEFGYLQCNARNLTVTRAFPLPFTAA